LACPPMGLAEIQAAAGLGELFDTLLVFENYPLDRERLSAEASELRLTGMSGVDATHYALSMAVSPGERLGLRLSYRSDLFERANVERVAERFVQLLESAVADPERTIGSLEMLAPDERRMILKDWNETAQLVPSATLPQLFAAQAGKTPDAI